MAVPAYLLLVLLYSHLIHAAPAESGTFAGHSTRNVTAFIGQQIEIPCNLKASADSVKLVWTHWDSHTILTINHIMITRDERISSIEKDGSWSLVIENVQRKDAGTYRCQINTSPLLVSVVNLQVTGCEEDEFACGGDQCIARNRRCDGLNHCVDGEDEQDCLPEDCKGVNIYCGNGKCIPIQYFCDENDDCGNGFDEANCSRPLPVDCPAGEFPCGDGECVPLRKHCDGVRDCENGFDEHPESCQPPTTSAPNANVTTRASDCVAALFSDCGDGKCVPSSWWCDGEVDCDNAADEKRCAATDCQAETTYCGNGVCTRGGRCDGKDDCVDNPGYDEKDCSPSDCFPGARYCGNGRCAASHMICDGIDQCGNGADEEFCDPLPRSPAPATAPPATTAAPSSSGSTAVTPSIQSRGLQQPPGLEELVLSIARASNQSLVLQRMVAAMMWRSCRLQYITSNGMLSDADHELARSRQLFSCEDGPYSRVLTVDLSRRCDGREDCPGGRDERECNVEEVCGPDPNKA